MTLPKINETTARLEFAGKFPLTTGAPTDTPTDSEKGIYRFDPATGILYAWADAGWLSVTLA